MNGEDTYFLVLTFLASFAEVSFSGSAPFGFFWSLTSAFVVVDFGFFIMLGIIRYNFLLPSFVFYSDYFIQYLLLKSFALKKLEMTPYHELYNYQQTIF